MTPPTTASQLNQPLDDVEFEKSVYIDGGRTWHQGINPSKERLTEYKFRKLVPSVTTYNPPPSNQNNTFPKFYEMNEFIVKE